MNRLFMLCAAALFLACTDIPEGLCDDDSMCLPGLHCKEGVCAGCLGDDECQAWEMCAADRRCALREGMCATNAQCKTWEACGASHTCELAEGFCLSPSDCGSHENCNDSTKRCVLQDGRCNTASNCGSSYLWTPSCDADNWCRTAPSSGNDVLIWGTLSQGSCGNDGISSVMSPTRVQVGFDCESRSYFDAPVVSPNGRVYYMDAGTKPKRVKIFVPDTFPSENGVRSYPRNGTRNDTLVPAPACSATDDVSRFVMQAGTGDIAYTCSGHMGLMTYYDRAGAVVASTMRVIAWNASDYMLGDRNSSELFLMTPERTDRRVMGLPLEYSAMTSVVDARAHPTGFMVAFRRIDTRTMELWHIDHDGIATLDGTYGAVPENINAANAGVLDATGALYSQGTRTDVVFIDVIIRRRPDGTVGTVVYSEDSAPASVNFGSNYERLFNFLHISELFAGP
ncbi:hypothetical protein [Myxococcus xanthus]|uniref:Lipoprotein n=1 Tax=Myxococcus xanthus TaxID=34 RepID=A0A7Y4IPG9_MYXXA|nr:hypothetical protein [Myxococcus xanthus]NOJ82360.1 hypothetical protein [Myxococcus xanthus]NOJ90304.1 hypothetical protein [Myxococcus xanthus]